MFDERLYNSKSMARPAKRPRREYEGWSSKSSERLADAAEYLADTHGTVGRLEALLDVARLEQQVAEYRLLCNRGTSDVLAI